MQYVNSVSTECKPFVPSQTCSSELMIAPTNVCATFDAAMIDVFCGQRDGGPPEAGSDATLDAMVDSGDGGG